MTVTFGAHGTYFGTGTADPTPTYPTNIGPLSELLLIVMMKPAAANGGSCATPAGWTLRGGNTGATDGDTGGYGTGLAADTGNMNLWIFSKDVVNGNESGTITVDGTGSNSIVAAIVRLRKSSHGAVTWASAVGKDTAAGNVSITTGAIDLAAGDFCFWAMAIPTDVTTPAQFSAHAISQTGSTFGTVTEGLEADNTSGNDMGGYTAYAAVTAGSGSGAATFTATAGGTTTNVRGPGVLIRARHTGAGVASLPRPRRRHTHLIGR